MKHLYNILVLEDNIKIAKLIAETLSRNKDYEIELAHNIKDAKSLLKEKHFDLICLDLILPDGDGLEVFKYIKRNPKHHLIKIIVLTKKISVTHRVDILERGVDDYLPKPFYPEELNARVKNLLGLTSLKEHNTKDHNLYLDEKKKVFKLDFFEISLTEYEYLILKFLFAHKGFASTDSLIEYISTKKDKAVTNACLTVTIKRLKDKIRRRSGKIVLKNKYGVGYELN